MAVPAQEWGHYANARHGYQIDVPPGFAGNGENSRGDGQFFYRLEAEQGLTVWGGSLADGLAGEMARHIAADERNQWVLAGRTETPQWGFYTARRGGRMIHQRMILLCDQSRYAAFRLEYNSADLGPMQALIGGLERSFSATGC